MPDTLCIIPRDREDQHCAVTSAFLAQVLEIASDLDVSMFALPSDMADPREGVIDAAYTDLVQRCEAPRTFLSEAISVTVNVGDAALGVLIAGVGRRIRDHQYRALIELDDPLDGIGELVLGVFRCGIVAFEHFDQLKLLQTPLTEPLCDFLLRLARGYVDGRKIEGAQHCWRKVLKITNNSSFLASYSLATSYAEGGQLDLAATHLDIAERAAHEDRQRVFVRWQRGMLALRREDPVAAREQFEACVDMWPGCGMAWVGLASARAREGDRVGALSALQRCLSLPEDEAAELGDAEQAAEVLLHDLGT
jgi:Tetratricopeptide repeat